MFSEWPRQTPKHKKQKLPLLLSRANSRHRFGGHVPLNLPLPVWTKTTLPADALQRGPVGAPHGQWPFHTASGQSGSLSSPWSNIHHHHHHHFPPSAPFLASLRRTWWCLLVDTGASPSEVCLEPPVLGEWAQASLGAPWWNDLKGPSLSQHQPAITAAWTGKAHLRAPQALNHG